MKGRNNNDDSMLSDVQKSCHSEMMTGGSSVLLSSPSSSPPMPSIDLKYHPLFRCNNTVEKSLVGSLSNYCDVEFLNELRLYLLRMNSHHNDIGNNNISGLIESSQQRKQNVNDNDTIGENVTCIRDMHHGSNDDSDILQLSLHSDKQTQSLSSSASSSGGLTTTKRSDITRSKALYGNNTIDSSINEPNYSTNQLSCNSSTRHSYLSKLFDRSISSNVKSLSPSIFSPTIRANTLPTTRILRQQSINHKSTWNNGNNHLICVNSSKVDTTNQDILANSNSISSINQKVDNRLHFSHRSDHRNSTVQDKHHFKMNTTISNDKLNSLLTRKFSHQPEIDHFSRIITTNTSSSNNNNKSNANRRSRKSNEQPSDKSTLSNCNVEQQMPVEYVSPLLNPFTFFIEGQNSEVFEYFHKKRIIFISNQDLMSQ